MHVFLKQHSFYFETWTSCHIRLTEKTPWKLTSDIFQTVDRRINPRNGIWNDPVVILSARSSNYAKVEDYQTTKENARWCWMWVRENGSSLNFRSISFPAPAADENWVSWSSAALFCLLKMVPHVMCACCSIQFKLFVSGRFTECFHRPVLWRASWCPTHTHPVLLVAYDTATVVPCVQ